MAPGPDSETQNDEKGGGGDGEGPDLDPLLMALLRKIPPVGKEWPQEPRARWFRTFAMNVSQIYDTGDEVVDLLIKIQKNEIPKLVGATEITLWPQHSWRLATATSKPGSQPGERIGTSMRKDRMKKP